MTQLFLASTLALIFELSAAAQPVTIVAPSAVSCSTAGALDGVYVGYRVLHAAGPDGQPSGPYAVYQCPQGEQFSGLVAVHLCVYPCAIAPVVDYSQALGYAPGPFPSPSFEFTDPVPVPVPAAGVVPVPVVLVAMRNARVTRSERFHATIRNTALPLPAVVAKPHEATKPVPAFKH